MKKTSIVAYAVAVCLASPIAFAQRHDGPGRNGPGPGGMRHDGPNMADHDHRQWSRGNRLPPEYRHNTNVVNNWQARHLRRPPKGYQWVQADNDLVLVAVTSGIIADIILNH